MQESNVNGILTRYNQLRPQGGNNLSPREGFYLIDKVYPSPTHPLFLIAEARWRPDRDGRFTEGSHQTIQLYALQLGAPDPSAFNPYEFIGSIIHVTGVRIVPASPEGILRNTIVCDWKIYNPNTPKNISDILRLAGNVSASRAVDTSYFDEPDTSFYFDGTPDDDN